MAGNWPRGIQRIPGTSPFVPHDSHLPIDSLYDKIPIQGLGPKFSLGLSGAILHPPITICTAVGYFFMMA